MTLIDWFGFLAVPGNEPLARPGAYLITHVFSEKCYVGIGQNVRKRILGHGKGDGSIKIYRAIQKYGRGAFVVQPIYYSLDGTGGLPTVEAELIVAWNSLHPIGYNIQQASGAVGPYGPEFGKIISAAHLISPAIKAAAERRRGVPQNNSQTQTPEANAKRIASLRKTMGTPEFRAERSAILKEVCSRPEIRESRSRNTRGRPWITNGKDNQRIPGGSAVPEGWRIGVTRHNYKLLSAADVDVIRQLLAGGMPGNDIAKKYNVSTSMISMIKNGKRRKSSSG
jgi:hypothetical protein